MGKINVLPKSVYNRISAGEVVERPSSVIKELFENSVDAGATEITVGIEHGGLTEIYVIDNGSGMEKDDIPKAFLPHATSKISRAEDLDTIGTLGFRGEALASIAAVSRCRISSKLKDNDIGYTLTCDGGSFQALTEAPCYDGTSVTVNDLFYNTPARLKFLKSEKSEERDVTDMVQKLVLANPYISVKYYADDRLLLQSYGGGEEDAVLAVYGAETIEKCYQIKGEKNGITLKGYIGNTNFYKSNRTYQTVIINGRLVTDSTVSSAAGNAYSNYLMKRQFPFFVLTLTVPPEVVDVNVHPRKAEVRFADNQMIYGAVYSLISKVLDGSAQALNIVVKAPKSKTIELVAPEPGSIDEEVVKRSKPVDIFHKPDEDKEDIGKPYVLPEEDQYKRRFNCKDFSKMDVDDYVLPKPIERPKPKFTDKIVVKDFSTIAEGNDNPSIDEIFKENKAYAEKLAEEKRKKELEAEQMEIETDIPVKYIGQVLNTYLVLEHGGDMILIDQHAMHERFLFDSFYEKVKTNKVVKQTLLYPYAFRTNPKEFDILYDQMQYFRKIGIDLEVADDNLFKVYSMPVELTDIDFDAFFADILTDENFKKEKLPGVLTEKLIQKACKSAIKSGYELNRMEIDALLTRLKNDWGLKCPHGRPIAVRISRNEIDKWFKRIV